MRRRELLRRRRPRTVPNLIIFLDPYRRSWEFPDGHFFLPLPPHLRGGGWLSSRKYDQSIFLYSILCSTTHYEVRPIYLWNTTRLISTYILCFSKNIYIIYISEFNKHNVYTVHKYISIYDKIESNYRAEKPVNTQTDFDHPASIHARGLRSNRINAISLKPTHTYMCV